MPYIDDQCSNFLQSHSWFSDENKSGDTCKYFSWHKGAKSSAVIISIGLFVMFSSIRFGIEPPKDGTLFKSQFAMDKNSKFFKYVIETGPVANIAVRPSTYSRRNVGGKRGGNLRKAFQLRSNTFSSVSGWKVPASMVKIVFMWR